MTDYFTISLRFYETKEKAEEIQQFLFQQEINSKIFEHSDNLGREFVGESPSFKYELLIHEKDHRKASQLLKASALNELNDIDPNYFLFDYSNDELIEILVEQDEWSELDILISEKILSERGVIVDEEELALNRQRREEELAAPEKKQLGWVIFGYVCVIMIPFVGIITGVSLWKTRKRLPNGNKVPYYDTTVRKNGQIIFYASIVHFCIAFFRGMVLPFFY
jgi:hypothetical protein